jgi:hypothetical protein
MSSLKKHSVEEVEHRPSSPTDSHHVGRELEKVPLPPPGSIERLELEKKLLRKLDWRVLPTVMIIFIMNYIDVSSLLLVNTSNDG